MTEFRPHSSVLSVLGYAILRETKARGDHKAEALAEELKVQLHVVRVAMSQLYHYGYIRSNDRNVGMVYVTDVGVEAMQECRHDLNLHLLTRL